MLQVIELTQASVGTMLSAGMRELTGAPDDREAWSQFIGPGDIVGIKVNCSGAPEINSNPEVVAAIIGHVCSVGVPPEHIYIYDRFANQMRIVNFAPHVPKGVNIATAEKLSRIDRWVRPVHVCRSKVFWRGRYTLKSNSSGC
jgi:hypothetical protein